MPTVPVIAENGLRYRPPDRPPNCPQAAPLQIVLQIAPRSLPHRAEGRMFASRRHSRELTVLSGLPTGCKYAALTSRREHTAVPHPSTDRMLAAHSSRREHTARWASSTPAHTCRTPQSACLNRKTSRCQQLGTSAMLSVIRSDHTKLHNHAQSRTTADELSTLSCLKLKLEPHTPNPLALVHTFEQPWLHENTYRT